MATLTEPRASLDKEKVDIDHVEYGSDSNKEVATIAYGDINHGYDLAAVKRLTRKIDFRLIPVLSLMYLISLVDRTNLAIARAANDNYMDKDLGMNVGDRYSIVTCIFFVPYIIFELPSQIGLRKFGARIWLGSAVLCWGIVMLAMGFAPNWETLAALRALLGIFESALFPGAAFLISCWYPRRDMAQRNVVFYITSAVGGSFAKPLGYLFSLAHLKGGRAGWEWVFIVYGIVTILVAIVGYIFLVDFPDRAKFLSSEEREMVQTRIERDRADSKPDPLTWAKTRTYMASAQPWLFAYFFFANATATYALAYFLPVILQQMGFSNVESMLLGTPMYFYALIPALSCGRISDRVKNARGPCIAYNALSVVVGTVMYSKIPASAKAARFLGIFIAVGGAQSNTPLVISWTHTAIRAQSKRAYCSALVVAAGGAGGIVGSTVFMQKEAKQGYPTGIWVTIALNVTSTIGVMCMSAYYHYMNKKAARGEVVLENHEDFRYQP